MIESNSHSVIAIDGPAASGKSSVAKELARRLGFTYVDTGSMYRAVTWAAVRRGLSPEDAVAVAGMVDGLRIEYGVVDGRSGVRVGGEDPGAGLKSDAVNAGVSHVAKIPEVRRRLVALQREFARGADIVMEGRDIGSVVFPETPHKFYIDASPEVRAKRRREEGQEDAIRERDLMDSTRAASPLVVAEDAVVVDSSELTVGGVVEEILGHLRGAGIEPLS